MAEKSDSYTFECDTLQIRGNQVLSASLYAIKNDSDPRHIKYYYLQKDNIIYQLDFPLTTKSGNNFKVTEDIVIEMLESFSIIK
jgi:hypothetical protein